MNSATYAPMMSQTFYSNNGIFTKKEDICLEKSDSGAHPDVWLQFTSKVYWPGPNYELQGGPIEIQPRLGIRGISIGSIKVDINEACDKAFDLLRQTNGGDKFVRTIDLYWVLYPGAEEPLYHFTTNVNNVITVGAYTGKTQMV
jgi:hypothetical protein